MVPRTYSRRSLLRLTGLAGVGAVTGCLDGRASGGSGTTEPVSILAAGSLQHALETGLDPSVEVPIRVEAHGSATVARMVAEGQRDPDIVTVADTALFDEPLSPPWYAEFASNALVLAYNADTEGGSRLAEAGPQQWYEPLVEGTVSLGRSDPDQDPLGYRSLFMLELASRYYDEAPNLRTAIPQREQIYPETSLLSQLETGSIDAALVYRNMAQERDYDYRTLPTEIDFSDPEYTADWYSTVSYELPSGQVVRGGPITYASTIRTQSAATRAVFDAHTTGTYLTDAGFGTDSSLPRYEGDVPSAVTESSAGTIGTA